MTTEQTEDLRFTHMHKKAFFKSIDRLHDVPASSGEGYDPSKVLTRAELRMAIDEIFPIVNASLRSHLDRRSESPPTPEQFAKLLKRARGASCALVLSCRDNPLRPSAIEASARNLGRMVGGWTAQQAAEERDQVKAREKAERERAESIRQEQQARREVDEELERQRLQAIAEVALQFQARGIGLSIDGELIVPPAAPTE